MSDKKEHLWEAWRDGRRIEYTDYESCVPPSETLASMYKAGYRFKVNGKAWKPTTRK